MTCRGLVFSTPKGLEIRHLAIVNSAESNTTEFTDPILKLARNSGVSYSVYQYDTISPQVADEFTACIISGSPRGDDIVAGHSQHLSWLRKYAKPVLGICAGHQILGVLNGAALIRGSQAEVSQTIDVRIDRRDEVFRGIGWRRRFRALANHVDAVTVPENFVRLASTDACPNQVMKHKQLPQYSVQFHAEFSCPWLISRFLKIAYAR